MVQESKRNKRSQEVSTIQEDQEIVFQEKRLSLSKKNKRNKRSNQEVLPIQEGTHRHLFKRICLRHEAKRNRSSQEDSVNQPKEVSLIQKNRFTLTQEDQRISLCLQEEQRGRRPSGSTYKVFASSRGSTERISRGHSE